MPVALPQDLGQPLLVAPLLEFIASKIRSKLLPTSQLSGAAFPEALVVVWKSATFPPPKNAPVLVLFIKTFSTLPTAD